MTVAPDSRPLATTAPGSVAAPVARAADLPYPSRVYAWYVVGLLTLAYAISLLDRWILSLLVGPVKAHFQVSDSQMGLLMGFWFAVFYVTMGLPFGWLADRYSRKTIAGLAMLFWCSMTAFCGLAKSFAQLSAARLGIGLGEAALSPSASSIIADSFPRERQNSALTFYNMGISMGMGFAYLIGGLIVAWMTTQPPDVDEPAHVPSQTPSHRPLTSTAHCPVHCAEQPPRSSPPSHVICAEPGVNDASHSPAQRPYASMLTSQCGATVTSSTRRPPAARISVRSVRSWLETRVQAVRSASGLSPAPSSLSGMARSCPICRHALSSPVCSSAEAVANAPAAAMNDSTFCAPAVPPRSPLQVALMFSRPPPPGRIPQLVNNTIAPRPIFWLRIVAVSSRGLEPLGPRAGGDRTPTRRREAR